MRLDLRALTGWSLGLATGAALATAWQEWLHNDSDQDLQRYGLVRDYVRESFIGTTSDEALLNAALGGMLSSLDPYSRYYPPAQAESFERETSGRYEGIGAMFRRVDGVQRVIFTLPDSPARQGGLGVGDGIVAIRGEDCRDWSEARFRSALSTDDGGAVPVTIEGKDGALVERELKPGSLKDPSLRHVDLLSSEPRVGWISVHSFTRETCGELRQALARLEAEEPLGGLVLDLRGNRGGLLEAAAEVANLFLPGGVIVTTRGLDQSETIEARPDQCSHPTLPLCLLVDGISASASEVVAGALQDHRRAVLVGEPTYGKGVVQSVRQFSPWGARAKVTSAWYESPAGRHYSRQNGAMVSSIVPDIQLVVSPDQRKLLHDWLAAHQPSPEEEPLLLHWQEELGQEFVQQGPEDAQLAAALELLVGEA